MIMRKLIAVLLFAGSIFCVSAQIVSPDSIESRQEKVLMVINGYPHRSKLMISENELLSGDSVTRRFIDAELPDLKYYGIEEVRVLSNKDISTHISCRRGGPLIIITTDREYYPTDAFVGKYGAKSGGRKYKLSLEADSSFILTETVSQKNIIDDVTTVNGRWCIKDGMIDLMLDDGCERKVAIRRWRELSLPARVMSNKRVIKLKPGNFDE